QVAALLEANGSLRRPVTAGDLTLLGSTASPAHPQHLAMSPTLADVTVLAQHMAHRLAEMGLIADDGDVFQYRPNRLVEGVLWVPTTLGGSPPTFSPRLHEEVLAEHRRRWGEHVAQLNGELLDRAPTAYTHLVLIELLSRLDVRSGEVREAVQGLKRLRSD